MINPGDMSPEGIVKEEVEEDEVRLEGCMRVLLSNSFGISGL